MRDGHHLVLDNAPSYLRDLMTLVGGHRMLPGLVLGESAGSTTGAGS